MAPALGTVVSSLFPKGAAGALGRPGGRGADGAGAPPPNR